jgi:hypothetical protein
MVTFTPSPTTVALDARLTVQYKSGEGGSLVGRASAWAAGGFADGSGGAAAAPATPAVAIANAPRIESSRRPERVI